MNYPNYITELISLATDMWQQGWDEYNGGNISYRLTESERMQLREDLQLRDFPVYSCPQNVSGLMEVPQNLQGEYLLITASGSHFRVLHESVSESVGIIELTEDGYNIIAGFKNQRRPTSEIFMHILAQSSRLKKDENQKVVVHNHATNIVLYSLLNNITSESLTLDLWSVLTESIVVFPDGIEVLEWEVPGTESIGVDTAKLLEHSRLVVWAKHGVLSTGSSYQECFGLIETANKAAGLALQLQQISGKKIADNNVLSHSDLRKMCEVLNVKGKFL